MRDDEYQRTAKALARETRMSDASAARIEAELLIAMSSGAGKSLVWRRYSGERKWLGAAVVVLAVGSIALWSVSRRQESTAPAQQVVSDRPSVVQNVPPQPPPKTTIVTSAGAPQSARRKRAVQRTQTAIVVSPNGFVELPWTAGLPAFESGEIVRVEVPVASLPAYGFDISSGGNRSVEADVLVGQDGLARAMRLVTNSARSTQ
jgi:hypothetical protein